MNLLLSIIVSLLGISLIGTFLQSRVSMWKNSQNMFFGCIGALIAYFLGLPVIVIILVWVLCIIISCILFKFINVDLFTIKSDSVVKIIISIAIMIILVGTNLAFFNGQFMEIFNLGNPTLYITIIMIGSIPFIPISTNSIMSYNLDDLQDGDTIYTFESFWDINIGTITHYDNKKITVYPMNSIVNKKYTVCKDEDGLYINIDHKRYNIKEISNKEITVNDIVKISKKNLKRGIIKPNDYIIIETENYTKKNKNFDFYCILPILMILFGIFYIFLGIYQQHIDTLFLKNSKIVSANIMDITELSDDEYLCDIEYSIDGEIYRSNIHVKNYISYKEYIQIKKGKRYTLNVYYNLDDYYDIRFFQDKNNYSIIIVGICWTIGFSCYLIYIVIRHKRYFKT